MFASAESFNWIQALGIAAASLLTKWGVEKAFGFVRPPKPSSNDDLRREFELKFAEMGRRVDANEEATSRNTTAIEHIGAEVSAMRGTLEGIAQRLNRWIAAAGQGD